MNIYYILNGLNGENNNEAVLEFVGGPFEITRFFYLEIAWYLIKVNTREMK